MDALHNRLAALADDAPTGGAPPAELWARGKRARRLQAVVLATTVLVVGAIGTGIGIRLADGDRAGPTPAGSVDIALPIEYPVGEDLPDLGDTPGPLAAAWLVPRAGGGPEAVGLVAETGTFGTLPVDLRVAPPEEVGFALSTDGRRIAYEAPQGELVVRDLVSGESYSPLSEFESRRGFTWVDAHRLLGLVAAGSDADGWVWEVGKEPTRVDYWDFANERDLWVQMDAGSPRSCSSPTLLDSTGELGEFTPSWGYLVQVPVLCDVLGIIDSEILLGHWNSDRVRGDWDDPHDGNGTVVALRIRGTDARFEDPALRRVVVAAGSPEWVFLATDLIGEALGAGSGAS